MDASRNAHQHDFTRANYRRLLQLAKAKYAFCTYTDSWPGEGFVLWRHDVDMSIHAAEKLAIIEAEEGVRATYFLLIHSTYYNLFEQEIRRRVRNIVARGHEVGLHLDLGFHGVRDEEELEKAIHLEGRWLEDLFGFVPKVFSFHDPDERALSFQASRYAGIMNCYAEMFRTAIGYCSDSNGYWRHRRLEDVLVQASDRRLQVLTHPEWWQDQPMSPRRRVHRCIDGRAEALKTGYDAALKALGRLNVA